MGRKKNDAYAELVSPLLLPARMKEKGFGPRRLARYCGHESHTQFVRLASGKAKTTSVRTADLIEEALDMRGILFARKSVKPISRTAERAAA